MFFFGGIIFFWINYREFHFWKFTLNLKNDQRIWSHLLKKPLMKKCSVAILLFFFVQCSYFTIHLSFQKAFCRSSFPKVFLGKGILKICSKFTREHLCRSVISISYCNHTSTWVFSCKFLAYHQNIFSKEHLWTAAYVASFLFD